MWCDNCFSRTTNAIIFGILLAKNQGFPRQYNQEDIREIYHAIPVSVGPTGYEKFDDPEEGRQWKYCDAVSSFLHLKNSQRWCVVRVLKNSLLIRISHLPPADANEIQVEGIIMSPWATTFAIALSHPWLQRIWSKWLPAVLEVDGGDPLAQKGPPTTATSENVASPGLSGVDNIVICSIPGQDLEPLLSYPPAGEELLDLPLSELDLASLFQLLNPVDTTRSHPQSASSDPEPVSNNSPEAQQQAAQMTIREQIRDPRLKSRGKQLRRISRMMEDREPEGPVPEGHDDGDQEDEEEEVMEDGDFSERTSASPALGRS